MRIRNLAGLVLALAVAACASPRIEEFAGTRPAFTPEAYFAGRTTGWGFVRDFWGQYRREFTVAVDGRLDGGELVLDERFTYADGSTDSRVWRITREPEEGAGGVAGYTGRADGIVGPARGQAAGRMMQWVYEMDLPIGGNTVRARFDDWLFLLEEGTLLGRATLEKYGFPLGEVVILFRKVPETDRTLLATGS
jgi:hypothetical protein